MSDWTIERLKAKPWNGQHFHFAHAKLDGWCAQLCVQENRRVVMYGRDTLPSMEITRRFPLVLETPWFRYAKRLRPRTCVFGELVAPSGKGSDVISSLLRGDAEFVPFAMPVCNDREIACAPLNEVEHYLRHFGFGFPEWFTYAEVHAKVRDDYDVRAMLMDLAAAKGYEGWVLKTANYADWWKLKAALTVDCVVTGWKPGKGKYANQVGALEVSVWRGATLTPIASVSGMTDDVRAQMSRQAAGWEGPPLQGRVCEVEYQYVGSGGRLRHPRFVRWRPDKRGAECTWDQLGTDP